MIKTLSITILIESSIIIGYAQWKRKPLIPLLLSGFFANLLTQSFLWAALRAFPFHYLITLFSMEILITLIEFLFLFFIRENQLNSRQAFLLSLFMNLTSFFAGWFMAV